MLKQPGCACEAAVNVPVITTRTHPLRSMSETDIKLFKRFISNGTFETLLRVDFASNLISHTRPALSPTDSVLSLARLVGLSIPRVGVTDTRMKPHSES